MQRVMRMAEQEGWVNLILFKMDLKGAFYLIFKFFKADDSDVGLMAQPLTDGSALGDFPGRGFWLDRVTVCFQLERSNQNYHKEVS
jgi:hypothetical protein